MKTRKWQDIMIGERYQRDYWTYKKLVCETCGGATPHSRGYREGKTMWYCENCGNEINLRVKNIC